jgi:hypothetical protein
LVLSPALHHLDDNGRVCHRRFIGFAVFEPYLFSFPSGRTRLAARFHSLPVIVIALRLGELNRAYFIEDVFDGSKRVGRPQFRMDSPDANGHLAFLRLSYFRRVGPLLRIAGEQIFMVRAPLRNASLVIFKKRVIVFKPNHVDAARQRRHDALHHFIIYRRRRRPIEHIGPGGCATKDDDGNDRDQSFA